MIEFYKGGMSTIVVEGTLEDIQDWLNKKGYNYTMSGAQEGNYYPLSDVLDTGGKLVSYILHPTKTTEHPCYVTSEYEVHVLQGENVYSVPATEQPLELLKEELSLLV